MNKTEIEISKANSLHILNEIRKRVLAYHVTGKSEERLMKALDTRQRELTPDALPVGKIAGKSALPKVTSKPKTRKSGVKRERVTKEEASQRN